MASRRSSDDDAGRKAAGILLVAARDALKLVQSVLQAELSENAIRRLEGGKPLLRGRRSVALKAVKAYHLPLPFANHFLDLLGEPPVTDQEWEQHRSPDERVENVLRQLHAYWHPDLDDRSLTLVAQFVLAISQASRRYESLRQTAELLERTLGRDLEKALRYRGVQPAAALASHEQLIEDLEAALAQTLEARLEAVRTAVTQYVQSGAHTKEGVELTERVLRLKEVAPPHHQPVLLYLLGVLHRYNQRYLEAAQELDRVPRIVQPDDLSSAWILAEANYASAMAYLDIGDGPALQKARSRLAAAEQWYERVREQVPDLQREIALATLKCRFQQARILTWGYRRGMGARFDDAEALYAELLGGQNLWTLENDPFFHASILKERADNLRLKGEAAKVMELFPEARRYFQEAMTLYETARSTAHPRDVERRVECEINLAYIWGLLGDRRRAWQHLEVARRMSLRAGLRKQLADVLMKRAQLEDRRGADRYLEAYAGMLIARSIESRRTEGVCAELVRRFRQTLRNADSIEQRVRRGPYRALLA